MKTQNWTVVINGKKHHISYMSNPSPIKHILNIDGQPLTLKWSKVINFTAYDKIFMIDGKELHFVIIRNKTDIAVDGVYLGSGKPYIPLQKAQKAPDWIYIFMCLCISVIFLSLKNIIVPSCLGLIGIMLCLKISSSDIDTKKKILYCSMTTIGIWLTFAFWKLG